MKNYNTTYLIAVLVEYQEDFNQWRENYIRENNMIGNHHTRDELIHNEFRYRRVSREGDLNGWRFNGVLDVHFTDSDRYRIITSRLKQCIS